MDARGKKSLALFPAKFQKSVVKRGSSVVVDESGREKALESGSKVACIVSQILFYEQLYRPEIFKASITDDSTGYLRRPHSPPEDKGSELSDDDELPPLGANLNRVRPVFGCKLRFGCRF